MGYSIAYDADSRLTISGLACDCPCEHNEPTQDIYVGNGILENLPALHSQARPGHALRAGSGQQHLGNRWQARGRRCCARMDSLWWNA